MASHNVLQGGIKGGVLTLTPHHIYLQSEMPFYADIELDNGHMRIKRQADGKLIGYMGGFLDWSRYADMSTARPGNDADAVPIQVLRRQCYQVNTIIFWMKSGWLGCMLSPNLQTADFQFQNFTL